jgi:hypothetical protein
MAQQNTAEKLIEAGHWKRARALVEPRLRQAPDDAEANYLASMIRNAFGDYSSPLPLAEKAVRLDGRVARYHRLLAEVQGVMAQRAGVFQQVSLARRFRKEIGIALELDARNSQALRDQLEFYLLAPGILGGDSKKAEQIAQQMVSVDAAEGFRAMARIAEFRKDRARQEAMLRQAVEARPPSYKAYVELGEFYLAPAHRNEAEAEAVGKAALSLDAGRVGGYAILAAVYAGRADWSSLETILTSAAQAVPDDATPYYRAAERILADPCEPARAEKLLRVYLAQEPEGNQPTAADAQRQLGIAQRVAAKSGTQLRRAMSPK